MCAEEAGARASVCSLQPVGPRPLAAPPCPRRPSTSWFGPGAPSPTYSPSCLSFREVYYLATLQQQNTQASTRAAQAPFKPRVATHLRHFSNSRGGSPWPRKGCKWQKHGERSPQDGPAGCLAKALAQAGGSGPGKGGDTHCGSAPVQVPSGTARPGSGNSMGPAAPAGRPPPS